MKVEDFAVWLSAISGMSEDQRTGRRWWRLRRRAWWGATAASGEEGRQASGARRTRSERPASSGWRASGLSPLRGPRNRRLGPFGRAFAISLQELRAHVQHADQDADGASAQEGEVARSRAAMIEGKSLAKTAELCGVHPTTAFRWRHRFLRAPSEATSLGALSGIVEADETFILESFKGRWSDLPTKGAKTGWNGQASRPSSGQYSHPRRPRPEGRDLRRRSWPQVDRRRGEPRPRRTRHAGQSSHRRRRQADRRFRPPRRHCLPRRALAGKADSRGAAPAHQQCQRLPRPPQAVAQPLQRRRHQEPAQVISAGGSALEAWGRQPSTRQNGSTGAIGNGPYQQITL